MGFITSLEFERLFVGFSGSRERGLVVGACVRVGKKLFCFFSRDVLLSEEVSFLGATGNAFLVYGRVKVELWTGFEGFIAGVVLAKGLMCVFDIGTFGLLTMFVLTMFYRTGPL